MPVPDVIPRSWAGAAVHRALAARIMADTGVDGYTATAMVAVVRERGSDSPHAEVVSAAAAAILAPVIDSFNRMFTDLTKVMQAWADVIGRAMKPLVEALARSAHDPVNGTTPRNVI